MKFLKRRHVLSVLWLAIGFPLLAAFQNCGSSQAFAPSTAVASAKLAAVEATLPVRSASAQLAPETNRRACAVQNQQGQYLKGITVGDQAACSARCLEASAAVCYWGTTLIKGNPLAKCVVKGGAHKLLAESQDPISRSACSALCDASQSNVNRYCDWATERIYEAPSGNECRVLAGDGRDLLTPEAVIFTVRSGCVGLCSSWASDPYRTCLHGREVLQQPTSASRC